MRKTLPHTEIKLLLCGCWQRSLRRLQQLESIFQAFLALLVAGGVATMVFVWLQGVKTPLPVWLLRDLTSQSHGMVVAVEVVVVVMLFCSASNGGMWWLWWGKKFE